MAHTGTRRHPPQKNDGLETAGEPTRRAVPTGVTVSAKQLSAPPTTTPINNVVRRLLRWYARKARDLPWRRTSDPYAIWIAEIMLQQTQVQTVIPYWERWLRQFPTVQALANADLSSVLKGWEGLGYYSRARNLHRAAGLMVTQFDGRVPERAEDLLALPGIGRYTAGAIGSIAFNQPVPVLDGNVIRVLTRLVGLKQDPRQAQVNKQLWKLAGDLIVNASKVKYKDRKTCADLNQSLMELGAMICTPRQPQCLICPLGGTCVARHQGNPEQYPVGSSKAPLLRREWCAFLIESRGHFLMRQRLRQTVNGELWEFPTVEYDGAPEAEPTAAASSVLGWAPKTLQFVGTFRHHITRYQILVRIFRAAVADPSRIKGAGEWLTLAELSQRPLAGAHRKIFLRYLEPHASPISNLQSQISNLRSEI
jgi:A/G-specific adenine glycosylase